MIVKRTSHAVYDTKYHLVWIPKYRKWILKGDLRQRVKELSKEIAEDFDFEIDTLEVMEDHVHIFLGAPPKYSIAKMVGILKSISASRIFEEFPEVKKQLWGGQFWSDGYFARTVGDKVTSDVIRRYIEHQIKEDKGQQLELF
jgi:putative transposase